MKLDIEPAAALEAIGRHIEDQRRALHDVEASYAEALQLVQAEANILRQVIGEREADVDRLTTALGEANAEGIALREKLAVSPPSWQEPADWPIPGHAPGLYSMYSADDANGAAVITENGRLLVEQDKPNTWMDHTDIYPSAQWPLTPVTVRITTDTEPGELVAYTNVYPPALAEGWRHDEVPLWLRDDLDAAVNATRLGCRTAAVYLLPEGGKA